ncbi:MAG TPA: hypothetical protein VGQ39_06410 [Pyrinomonadaceae bacterium]|jgi:hypothetical protein|nr:hypothetical protein [Pyrinomonadaceae bacterium]
MIPRYALRLLITSLSLAFIALGPTIGVRNENALASTVPNQRMPKIFCASTLDQPIVYFSKIFDANIKARSGISTLPLNFAFKNYLVEEYDFKTNSNFPANCGFFETLSQAEANKQQLVGQAQQANKQIVEVNWDPGPLVEVPQGDTVSIAPARLPSTHTFCMTGDRGGSYFSAVFDTIGTLPNPKWNDAFNDFLSKNYSFPGADVHCTSLSTIREAERTRQQRMDGLRRTMKVIDTGWKFDPSGVASIKPRPRPTPQEDDPEPAPRPAAPTQTQQTRDAAVKEMQESVAFCRKDPMLSVVFNCDWFARNVYNYRTEHPTDTSTLANLVAAEKVDLSSAIDNTHVSIWVMNRGAAQKLENRVINCISQNVIVTLYKKPQANHLQDFYNAAVVTCNKSP